MDERKMRILQAIIDDYILLMFRRCGDICHGIGPGFPENYLCRMCPPDVFLPQRHTDCMLIPCSRPEKFRMHRTRQSAVIFPAGSTRWRT